MTPQLKAALFSAEAVAHLRGFEREILPLADLARGQAARIAELEEALQRLVNVATHPQETKAGIRMIAKESKEVLARTVQPLTSEDLSAHEETNHQQALVAAFGDHGQG